MLETEELLRQKEMELGILKRKVQALTITNDGLVGELAVMTRLHALSVRFLNQDSLPRIFSEITEIATSITSAAIGNLQFFNSLNKFKITVNNGNELISPDFFDNIYTHNIISGVASDWWNRACVTDISQSPVFMNNPQLPVLLAAGIQGAQFIPLLNNSGNLLGVLSMYYPAPDQLAERDLPLLDMLVNQIVSIIERIRMEEALRDRELCLQLTLEAGQLSWHDYRPLTGEIFVDQACRRIWGIGPDDNTNIEVFWASVHPDDVTATKTALESALDPEKNTHYDMEYRIRPFDDSPERWVRATGHAIFEGEGNSRHAVRFIGTIQDITDQKHAEAALRESEEKLRLALDAAQLGMWDWNLQSDRLGWSERCKALFALKSDTVMTYDLFINTIHQEDRDRINYAVLESLENKRDYDVEFRIPWSDDTIHWVAMKGLSFYNTSGHAVRMAGIALDITERIRKTDEILASERELLKVTLNSLGEGVVATDQQERIILMNESAANLTGYSPAEAVGKTLQKILYLIDHQTNKPCVKILAREMPNSLTLVTRDLKEIPVAISNSPIKAAGRIIGAVTVFQDISVKQKTERELLKAEKIESLGILAGGIAHDFNNILAAILSNIQLAMFKLTKNEDIKPYLLNTIETTRKASDLTKQLLTFSKGGAPVKKNTSLNELIKDTSEFVLRGSKMKAKYLIPDDLCTVNIDEGQISQVIHNLIINAKQAMPLGGIIEIKVENITIKENTRFKPGKYLRITIKDQGIGILKEHLPKIFDPFFTTKKDGNGLGLATSYSIISQHNGYIEVESQEGAGTSFFIYLPATNVLVESVEAKKEIAVTGTGSKILIMDDEVAILNAVGEMLKCYGYQVALTTDGAETIAVYKQAKLSGEPFEVVIMDLTVPGGMGGQEASMQLHDFDPQVKVIISSGYANDPVMADYKRYGFVGVVGKPYKIEELNEVLYQVINPAQLPLKLIY